MPRLAERLAMRAKQEVEERKRQRNARRRSAYYAKYVADRPAKCHECGAVKTAKDMFAYARREVSVKNLCWECFEKDDDTMLWEPEYAGDHIYWKMNP